MGLNWYYASGGVQEGPMAQQDLMQKYSSGQLPADAVVWREGMDNWKPYAEVAELAGAGAPVGNQPVGQIYGAPVSGAMVAVPPTYLWQSIVCTLLCCLPFGIVGIVYAAKVESLARAGDAAGAKAASDSAKLWCWLSFGIGLGVSVLYLFVAIAGA